MIHHCSGGSAGGRSAKLFLIFISRWHLKRLSAGGWSAQEFFGVDFYFEMALEAVALEAVV